MVGIGDFLKLSEIVEKVKVEKVKDDTISLPTIQRGFVWRPYQIENFWDSLLRGYPVGSFVLSQKNNSKAYEILDGQQRASAICLGFYNPLDSANNNKIFKTSVENFMIFIDLARPKDNRKYIFRVITKSHPWGYSIRENQKTLESKDIRKAMNSFRIEGYNYLKKPLIEFWPYDSYKPIPLGLFLNAKDEYDLKNRIEEWKKGKNLDVKNKKDEKTKSYSIEEIFDNVRTMLEEQKIPVLFLDLQKLYNDEKSKTIVSQEHSEEHNLNNDEDNNKENENGQLNVEDRRIDEIENLFIRLNSGGTPLSGEELNYSILKARIPLDLQNSIEEKCSKLFKPPRFITIAFRLFNSRSDDRADSISMRIKPSVFQRSMMKESGDFEVFIKKNFIDTDNIAEVKKLLLYNEQHNPNGLPPFILYTLAARAPEVMFMLLYRLLIKKDENKKVQQLKDKVLGMITLFTWLGKGDKERDYAKLLNNVWPCVKYLDTERFWSNETVQRAILKDNKYEILTPFPKLNKLNRLIPKPKPRAYIRGLTYEKICNSDYGNFIEKIFFNKDIILYAQRHALSEWFGDIANYDLDDTNRVFDWDHICPKSYVYNKRNIHRALRDWYDSNGNFRAWPYSLNRKDQDLPPSKKLNPKDPKEIEWWKKHLKMDNLTEESLKKYLLERSFCEEKWLDLDNDLKDHITRNDVAKKIIYLILQRNYKICEEWYKNLRIDDLIPKIPKKEEIDKLFGDIINNVKWTKKKEKNEEGSFLSYKLSIGENLNLYFYFQYSIETNILKKDGIEFGIRADDGEVIKGVKIPEKLEDKYEFYNDESIYIYTKTTLISYSEDSIIELFKTFNKWLKGFPDNKIKKNIAIERFHNSIKKNFKDLVFCN